MTSSAEPAFGLAAAGVPESATTSVPATTRPAAEVGRLRGIVTNPPASDRFEDRFDDLAAVAYRVAYRLLGSRPDAEDLMQETLTRAYQRWRTVRSHAEPWVARVAANLALDAIRRDKRRPTVSDAGGQDRAAPTGPSVLDRIELVQRLRDLPKRQREVVVLRYLADLSEVDVAVELGISVGSVKQHGSRGLTALRLDADADAAVAAGRGGSDRTDAASRTPHLSRSDTPGRGAVTDTDNETSTPASPDHRDQGDL